MEGSKKNRRCPRCASKNVLLEESFDDGADLYVCVNCDHEFEIYGPRAKQQDVLGELSDDIDLDSFDDGYEGMYPA
jgi:DNA-directed RNA polymerase subunit RPC12/RpoP